MADRRFEPYVHDQSPFRAPLFKKYCPSWGDWSALERLVKLYADDGHEGVTKLGDLQPGERAAIRRLIDRRCTPEEKRIVEKQVAYHTERYMRYARTESEIRRAKEQGEEYALLETFCIEYRREAAVASERCEKAFEKSDFVYKYQFLAVDLGFVRTNDYDRRKR